MAGILALAAGLRLWELEIKPLHPDEAGNMALVEGMAKTGFYEYDPVNYHGPLYFYFLKASVAMFGHEIWALRLPAVIFSIASIGMAWRFRRWFGDAAALLGALVMAISPCMVFYGRYAIHESLFSLSLMGCVYGVGLWLEGSKRNAAWWFFLSLACAISVKETYLIHLVALLLAFPCLYLLRRINPKSCEAAVPSMRADRKAWIYPAVSAVFIVAAIYSQAFTKINALSGLYETFAPWIREGIREKGHAKAWHYWLELMIRYEWPILLGMACACLPLFLRTAIPVQIRYLMIYAAGCLVAYSIIPYKTPWCAPTIFWPFALIFAWVVVRFASVARKGLYLIGILAPVLLYSGWTTCRLNFINFDSRMELYAYVQPHRELHELFVPLNSLPDRAIFKDGLVFAHIYLKNAYPIPWYLHGRTECNYAKSPKRLISTSKYISPDMLIVDAAFRDAVESRLKGDYSVRAFRFTSNVPVLFVYYSTARFGMIPDWDVFRYVPPAAQ